LIDRIVVTPTKAGDRLTVDLIGDLAGILSIASKRDRKSVFDDLSRPRSVQQTGDPDDGPRHAKTAANGGLANKVAMVAGGRFSRDFASSSYDKEAVWH
jgi:hypothetical protein